MLSVGFFLHLTQVGQGCHEDPIAGYTGPLLWSGGARLSRYDLGGPYDSHAHTHPLGELLPRKRLTDEDYQRLLEFRTGLRRFLAWSRSQASGAGLAPSQHQLLLAIRGHHDQDSGPTIGDVAGYLLLKPHSAAELVGRAHKAGLVQRLSDPEDARVVRLRLTKLAEKKLESITAATLEELERMGPQLRRVWKGLGDKK